MQVKKIYVANVVSCAPGTTIAEAARLMRERHVGDVVIVDDPQRVEGLPLGILTDRDVAVEVVGRGLDPCTTPVGSLMRSPIVIAYDWEDVSTVIERMRQHGIRRVPVVANEGEVVGIVSLEDLLRALVDDAGALLDAMVRGRTNEREQRGTAG